MYLHGNYKSRQVDNEDELSCLLSQIPKEMKPVCQRDTCTSVLITVLLTIAKVSNQHQGSSSGELRKYGVYLQWNTIQLLK